MKTISTITQASQSLTWIQMFSTKLLIDILEKDSRDKNSILDFSYH